MNMFKHLSNNIHKEACGKEYAVASSKQNIVPDQSRVYVRV